MSRFCRSLYSHPKRTSDTASARYVLKLSESNFANGLFGRRIQADAPLHELRWHHRNVKHGVGLVEGHWDNYLFPPPRQADIYCEAMTRQNLRGIVFSQNAQK